MNKNYMTHETEMAATIVVQDIAKDIGYQAYGFGSFPMVICKPTRSTGVARIAKVLIGRALDKIGALYQDHGEIQMRVYGEEHKSAMEMIAAQITDSLDLTVHTTLYQH